METEGRLPGGPVSGPESGTEPLREVPLPVVASGEYNRKKARLGGEGELGLGVRGQAGGARAPGPEGPRNARGGARAEPWAFPGGAVGQGGARGAGEGRAGVIVAGTETDAKRRTVGGVLRD